MERTVGFDNPHTTNLLHTADSMLGISVNGGYVTDWRVRKPYHQELTPILHVHPDKLKRTGIPPLVPNYGPSESLGQHGFGRDTRWQYYPLASYLAELRLSPSSLSQEAREAYPHNFSAVMQLYIAESRLGYRLDLLNRGDEPMPVLPGLHPYFHLPLEGKSELKVKEAIDFDARKVDWNSEEHDQEYLWSNPYGATIDMPDRIVTIGKRTEGRNTQRLVIWSEPGTDYICVEPISGTPNQMYDNEPFMVEPKGMFRMDLMFRVRFK